MTTSLGLSPRRSGHEQKIDQHLFDLARVNFSGRQRFGQIAINAQVLVGKSEKFDNLINEQVEVHRFGAKLPSAQR